MELIDREATIKALVDEAKTIDGKRFEEPNLQHVFDFGGIIRSMPTVQAVPIEVLDKIRADIDAHREKLKIMADDDWYAGKIRGYDCAIEIIDKYRGSEVQSDTK